MGTPSRILAGTFVVLIGRILIACGDDDATVPAPPPPTDATMSAVSSTLCQKITECTGDYLIKIAYGNLDGCVARTKQQFVLDVQSAGYGVDDVELNACLTAVKGISCTDVLDNKLPEACRIKGTLADGSNCTNDSQCLSGSCFVGDTATCGKCGPRAAAGTNCTNASCDYGLRCNATKLCTDGSTGSACEKDDDCRAFTVCRAKKCTPLLEENAPCTVSGSENESFCNILKGLFCQPAKAGDANGTCKAAPVKFAAAGEKCGVTSIVPLEFTACTNSECENNLCVAHLADGAACTEASGQPKCQEPANCRDGKCALKDPAVCK